MRKKQIAWPYVPVIVGLHILGIWGATKMFEVGWESWAMFAGLFLSQTTGTSMGYHRLFTHHSFACSQVTQRVLLAFGAISLQGRGRMWAHRHVVHHAFADKPGLDTHTPLEYPNILGFLWAHMGWVFCVPYDPPGFEKPKIDQRTERALAWDDKWYLLLFSFGMILPFLVGGWDGLLFAGCTRLLLGWHMVWSTNSFAHTWGGVPKDADGNLLNHRDGSRNFWTLGWLSFGEVRLHGNHHHAPHLAYLGWSKWDVDVTKWLLILLEKSGLAWDIKKPSSKLTTKNLAA